MAKKCLKFLLVLIMAMAVGFSILTLTTQKAQAVMKELLLHEKGTPGEPGYSYWCGGLGQGCYIVTPPPAGS